MMTGKRLWVGLALVATGLGCGHAGFIPGTNIPATQTNQEIVQTIEDYRTRLIQKDVDGLLLLASKHYFEDGGTPQPDDDYGYEGLANILTTRLQRVGGIRYDIQYKNIRIRPDGRAEVEAFLNGAFDLEGETGERYQRIADYHRFVLEPSHSGGTAKWLFVAGM
jgi:hypothetical protein